MKKIITFMTLAAVAVSAQSASIDWSISGVNSALATYVGGVAANTTVYFVLGTASTIDTLLAGTGTAADFASDLSSITLATTSSGADGKKPSDIYIDNVFSASLVAGTTYSFGMLFVSEDASGNGYYKLVTATAPAYTYVAGDASGATAVATSWATMKSDAWTQGYAPVPEPATAALALAGLAMLIRRRK